MCIYMRLAIHDLFFFNDTATTEIYTLSLHDALPIYSSIVASLKTDSSTTRKDDCATGRGKLVPSCRSRWPCFRFSSSSRDRKSTRLNSSHANISYAVFCLKKKQIIKSVSIDYIIT